VSERLFRSLEEHLNVREREVQQEGVLLTRLMNVLRTYQDIPQRRATVHRILPDGVDVTLNPYYINASLGPPERYETHPLAKTFIDKETSEHHMIGDRLMVTLEGYDTHRGHAIVAPVRPER
jgi:hypothetical protein